MAAAAVTTKKLCISALRQLQTQTRKYSNIVSIFETWYEEGGQDDETLRIEFADVIDESSFIEAARGKKEIRNDEEAQQIFNAIKNALTVPTEEKEQMSLPLLLLTTKLPDDWEKQLDSVDFELRESVKRQASKLVTGDGKGCMDVLRLYVHCILYDVVLCIPDVLPSMTNSEWLGKLYHRYNGTYPLLNHFVDAYTRCRVNEWIANNRKPINMSIATIFSPKYFCSHPEWKKGKHLDYVKTAVKSYTTRLVPEYSCIAFTYKLKTEPKDAVALLDVLFAAVEGVNRQLTWVNAEQNTLVEGSLVPFQFDLLILHHPSDLKKNEPMSGDALDFGSDSDSDEDEDEDDEEDESESDNPDEDQFDTLWHPKGKQEHNDFVEKLLEDNKIKFEIHSAVDPNQKLKGGGGDRLDRLMDAGLNEFVKLKRQRQRAILVADLSQVDEDGIRTNTRIFSVHPPKESAGFESFATLSPPALHMNSVVKSQTLCISIHKLYDNYFL